MSGTALITGGAGFIGSHVADRMLANGWSVVAVDNLAIGRKGNVAHLEEHPRFSLELGDVTDRSMLMRLAVERRVDVIVHLAAVHYIPFCTANPYEAMRINVLGTQAVIDAAVAASARRILFASTSDVYALKELPLNESDPIDPYTVYGSTKMMSERLLWLATTMHPTLSVAVARLFNVYGPRETNPHVLPEILDQLKTGDVVRLGNLWPRRDFVYVEDVAEAFVALLGSEKTFDAFNVGSGVATSIGEAVDIIGQLLKRSVSTEPDPQRARPVERSCLHADIGKITRVIGWTPRRTFGDGMTSWMIAEGLLDGVPVTRTGV